MELFARIEPYIYKYPAVNAKTSWAAVEAYLKDQQREPLHRPFTGATVRFLYGSPNCRLQKVLLLRGKNFYVAVSELG